MVSLATQTDRTLFFDFLPIDLGQISGFSTRFQLYTVPGQVYYNATRRLVLQGADGVVFVGDSQARQLDENLESLQNLQSNLVEHGVDVRTLPRGMQYNKQDLPPELILPPPELNMESLPLDESGGAFHAAIAAGQGDAFRRRFQNVDALLVDDVQFLTNRKEMQAELLRLTEALQQAGHQIVLASDRPPAEIADLDERLISRFSGGLVVDIGIPDYETRVAILRRKSEERGSTFQPGVLETVAKSEFPNVRELMGALNRIVAYQAVNDTPINAEAARQLLGTTTVASPTVGSATVGARTVASSTDEFSQFLTDVTVTVGKAVEAWRARVAEAVLRWQGEGYRTGRLEKLLDQETPAAVDEAIAAYVQDVDRLKVLEAEVAALDPQAAGEKVFHDPDRMDEAESAAAKVRDGAAPPPGPSAAFPFDSYIAGPSNDVVLSP